MDLEQLLGGGAAIPKPGEDVPTMDTAEVVHISSLALLKVRRADNVMAPTLLLRVVG